LCVRHELTLLTTDGDFRHIAQHCALRIWGAQPLNAPAPNSLPRPLRPTGEP
jgi:hypothetical protein